MENHVCITHDDSSGDLPTTQPITNHIEMLLTHAKQTLLPTQTNNSHGRDIRISADSVKLKPTGTFWREAPAISPCRPSSNSQSACRRNRVPGNATFTPSEPQDLRRPKRTAPRSHARKRAHVREDHWRAGLLAHHRAQSSPSTLRTARSIAAAVSALATRRLMCAIARHSSANAASPGGVASRVRVRVIAHSEFTAAVKSGASSAWPASVGCTLAAAV